MAYTYPVAPANTIYQVTLKMAWCNQVLMNTFHYRLDANPSSQTVLDHYVSLDAWFATANKLYPRHKALRDVNCALDTVTIQAIAPSRFVASVFTKAEAGDIIGTTDTANLSSAISRRSVGATRADIGGIRIPLAIATTTIVDGVLTAAYDTLLDNLASFMLESFTNTLNSVFVPVLYHRGKVPNNSKIEAVFRQSNVRTMSRRTVGRGI